MYTLIIFLIYQSISSENIMFAIVSDLHQHKTYIQEEVTQKVALEALDAELYCGFYCAILYNHIQFREILLS